MEHRNEAIPAAVANVGMIEPRHLISGNVPRATPLANVGLQGGQSAVGHLALPSCAGVVQEISVDGRNGDRHQMPGRPLPQEGLSEDLTTASAALKSSDSRSMSAASSP